MTKCVKCGAESWSVEDKYGALQTWRCNACGTAILVHVNYSGAELGFAPDLSHVFRFCAHWKSKPSIQQASDMKKYFPILQSVSAYALVRKAIQNEKFELGIFTENQMQKFEPFLSSIGIEISRLPDTARSP